MQPATSLFLLATSALASLRLPAPALAQTPFPNPPSMPPFTDLLASYPWGPETAMEATPDNRRAFVAAGAGLSVLDVEQVAPGVPPTVLERI